MHVQIILSTLLLGLSSICADEVPPLVIRQFTFGMLKNAPFVETPYEFDGDQFFLQGTKALYAAGVPLNLPRALELLTKGANRGHPGAMSQLATMYSLGIGVKRDPAFAAVLHTFASRAGQHVSTMALGYDLSRSPATACEAAAQYLSVASIVQDMKKQAPDQVRKNHTFPSQF